MKKYVWIVFLLLLCMPMEGRKKVAVVLSGGGAKGVAHIGALKVIEEAGIPIDYVVGTSMGSIVGGLYSIGYTPHQLDSMVNDQNWLFLLSDKVEWEQQTFAQKELEREYVLSVPYSLFSKKVPGGGVINGDNIYALLQELTQGYHDSIDFNRLPIPFACVATNVVDGDEVNFHSGVLPTAMRASMAIPAVFNPVRMDGMVLVDGGMVNNFPVNIALRMGAECIIGVDVQSALLTADKLTTAGSIIGQIVDLTGQGLYEKNKQLVNVYIHPDVEGYSAASFSKSAIDSLMENGEKAARAKFSELLALKQVIGVDEAYMPPSRLPFVCSLRHKSIPTSLVQQENTVNLGLRFDTEEVGALLLNTLLYFKGRMHSKLLFTGQLGKTLFASADYSLELQRAGSIGVGYMYRYNDIDIYQRGKRRYNTTYASQRVELSYSNVAGYNRLKYEAGLQYDFFDYNSFLYSGAQEFVSVKPEGFFSCFVRLNLETLDRWYFPNKGLSMQADYSLYAGKPFSALSLSALGVTSPGSRLTLLTTLYGRVLIGSRIPYPYLNAVGGYSFGRKVPQQMPFVGINQMEIMCNSFLAAKLQVRQRLGKKNYVSFLANYAIQKNNFLSIFSGQNIWGGGVSYAYNSLFGPLEATIGISGWTKKVAFYGSLGYVF